VGIWQRRLAVAARQHQRGAGSSRRGGQQRARRARPRWLRCGCPQPVTDARATRTVTGPSRQAAPGKGFVMLLTVTRLITAALLVASAAAFATGAALEHHTAARESHSAQRAEASTGENAGSAEGAASGESPAMHATEHSSETLLGIDPEAAGLVVAAVTVSLVLAALILTVGSPVLAAGVALVMLVFTALDIREVTHQLNESHPGLAALAAAIATLHLLAGAAALLTIRQARTQPDATAA